VAVCFVSPRSESEIYYSNRTQACKTKILFLA